VYDELFNVFQTTIMIDCAISIVVSSILDCAKRENNIHAWKKSFRPFLNIYAYIPIFHMKSKVHGELNCQTMYQGNERSLW